MTCDRLRESYDTFALGIEDGPEAAEIGQHLRRDCDTCVPGVRRSLQLAAELGQLAQLSDPPARLRKRILGTVNPLLFETDTVHRQPKSSFGWSVLWSGAALTLLCVAALLTWQLQRVSTARVLELSRLNQVLSVMSAPDSEVVNFGANQKSPPRGKVILNRKRGVVLIASNMPNLAVGKTFELWLIPRTPNAKPIPSGLFNADTNGTALAIRSGDVWDDIGTIAVSVENEGGAPAPTTTPIIAASAS